MSSTVFTWYVTLTKERLAVEGERQVQCCESTRDSVQVATIQAAMLGHNASSVHAMIAEAVMGAQWMHFHRWSADGKSQAKAVASLEQVAQKEVQMRDMNDKIECTNKNMEERTRQDEQNLAALESSTSRQ